MSIFVSPVTLCHRLELGPRKLERFQEPRFHKSLWARLVINMKGFDEKPFAEGNVFFHLLVSEGSSQQPCPMDGTQEQGMRCVFAMLGLRL